MSTISFLMAAATVVPAGQTFTCTPIRVWDGDGPVCCAEGPRIRLAGIAAREIDGTCRPNQPCPAADAVEARDALVSLIGVPTGRSLKGHVLVKGPAMQRQSMGDGAGNRTAAWCVSPKSGDVSCAMVKGAIGSDTYLFFASDGGATVNSAIQITDLSPSSLSIADFV